MYLQSEFSQILILPYVLVDSLRYVSLKQRQKLLDCLENSHANVKNDFKALLFYTILW